MPNVTKIACAIALPLLMSGCLSSLTQPTLPKAAVCQPPPAPAAWIMQAYKSSLTQRMLNELSPSPMKATVD